MKLVCLFKRITAIIKNTLQTKLHIAPVVLMVTDMSRLLRSSSRAVSCCLALAVQQARHSKARHSTYDFFLYQNEWAR